MIDIQPLRLVRRGAARVRGGSWQVCLGSLGLIMMLGQNAQAAGSVTLGWEPSSNSDVAGYRVYQGGATQMYTNMTEVGAVTNATLTGLTAGATYYFAVTAYDTAGLESLPSGELSWTVPAALPPTIVLTAPADGATFSAPAALSLAATVTANGHTLNGVRFLSGSTLLVEDTLAPYAFAWTNVSAGSYSLTAQVVYDGSNTVSSAPVSITVKPPPSTSGLTLAVDSASVSSPFVVTNGAIYQTAATGVTNGGRAVYQFTVPSTGDYLISAAVNAPNVGANSFFINVDAEPTDPTMIWDLALSTGWTNELVSWRGNGTDASNQFTPKVFNLAQGTHQLIVRGREGYTQLGTITIAPAIPLPAPWQTRDLGGLLYTGQATVSNGLYYVSGAGALSGSSDSFRFLFQPMSGNGEIRAQLNSIRSSSTNGCSGVMIRESLAAGSRYVFMGLLPNGTFRTQYRSSTSGGTSAANAGSGTPPNTWVRVVRSNNWFYTYKSADGTNWQSLKAPSISMATNVYVGFAVASGSTNGLSNATFTHATVVP